MLPVTTEAKTTYLLSGIIMAVGGGQPSALQCTVYYTVYGIEGLTSVVTMFLLSFS